jgi:hypothetical protein
MVAALWLTARKKKTRPTAPSWLGTHQKKPVRNLPDVYCWNHCFRCSAGAARLSAASVGQGCYCKELSTMEPERDQDDIRDWLLVTAGHFIVIGVSATYLLW